MPPPAMSIRRPLARCAALALAGATAACLGTVDPPVTPVLADPATTTFAPALGVDLATMTKSATGLYYRDEAVGTGTPVTATDSVALYLAGYLSTGERIAFSRETPPAAVRPSTRIAGLTEGITGMRPGGRRKLVIPPALGYGFLTQAAVGNFPVVPANSVLVYDVEVVGVVE